MRAFLYSLAHRAGARTGLLAMLVLALATLRPNAAQATHIRAGDIQSKVDTTAAHNPNRIFFKMTLFCNPQSTVKQPDVDILFGDGSRGNFPKAQTIPVNSQVVIYTYYFDHIFPGPKAQGYLVEFVGENRVDGILNINGGNSVNVTFYINTRVFPDPALGLNHSAVLRAPAYDQGAIKQVFLHNPAVYDADGDSVTVQRIVCQQVANGLPAGATNVTAAPVPNYVYPNSQTISANATQIPFPGIPAGNPANTSSGNGAAIYDQDLHTGQIVWNAPAVAGFYNVAMLVQEYRRLPNKGFRLIGQVIRDMQIIIQATQNLPPLITVPPDVCVQAGQQVTLNVSAIDQTGPGSAGTPTPVTLFAYAGIIPPATFVQNNTGINVTGTFKWTPDCSNVSDQPYTVLFKAQDSPPNTAGNPLIDERPVHITVVGPPPQNLKATVSGTTAVLSWDKYVCSNASQILIFRRDAGCYPYTPGPCDTGLPASAGYTQIGSVASTVTTFADDNGGKGLNRGTSYSYRIYAVFPLPGGGKSIVSNEVCLRLSGRSVLLTNVDVQATDAIAGLIGVKWTKPRSNNGDTIFTKPYGYRLSRATSATGTFTLVATKANRLNDTTFVDTQLNTTALQYVYKLEFYQNVTTSAGTGEQVDPAVTASSVRTTLQPDGNSNTITVNFAYTVPWDNSKLPAKVFRRTGTTGIFAQVGTITPGAASGTYVDKDPSLQRGQQYCYYVQTAGQYADYLLFLNNLLNNSQIACAVLRPTPCTPVLSLRPINCDSLAGSVNYFPDKQTYRNQLTWTAGSTPTGCNADAAYYRLYRATTSAGPFVLLDSTRTMSYLNGPLTQQNYCYQVQAVTATGERSALSNIVCQNECVFFILPNIFIPGSNVEANRLFRPKTSSPIAHTHIQIFNRWGRKVYESDADPYINWSGGGVAGESTTSSLVSDGIYYYLAEVEFADSNHTKKVYKGWVEKH